MRMRAAVRPLTCSPSLLLDAATIASVPSRPCRHWSGRARRRSRACRRLAIPTRNPRIDPVSVHAVGDGQHHRCAIRHTGRPMARASDVGPRQRRLARRFGLRCSAPSVTFRVPVMHHPEPLAPVTAGASRKVRHRS